MKASDTEKELSPKTAACFTNDNPPHTLVKRKTCLVQAALCRQIAYVSAHRRQAWKPEVNRKDKGYCYWPCRSSEFGR